MTTHDVKSNGKISATTKIYGKTNMYYTAAQETMNGQTEAGLFHNLRLELKEQMKITTSFHAETMGDIMYFHQVIRQPDTQEFVKIVVKEVEAQLKNNLCVLVKRDTVMPNMYILPSVWAMHCKRNLTTHKVQGHKTRLNIHGTKRMQCQLFPNICPSCDMV